MARPPLILPRPLIFFASLWLIGSWLTAIGLHAPLHPVSASYEPGVRLMLLCMMLGLVIGWPLLRLSQTAPPSPLRHTLLDMFALLALVQVVIWPLRLVTTWSVPRTAAIDAAIAGWLILAGAVVGAALLADQRGPRLLAMLACIAMCLLAPFGAWAAAQFGADAGHMLLLSSILHLRFLSEGGGAPPTHGEWQMVALVLASGIGAWTALGALSLVFEPPAEFAEHDPNPPDHAE